MGNSNSQQVQMAQPPPQFPAPQAAGGSSDPYDIQKLTQYKQVFDRLDLDNSGALSAPELQAAFSQMGVQHNPHQVNQLLNQFDANGNKELDFPEFLMLMNHETNGSGQPQAQPQAQMAPAYPAAAPQSMALSPYTGGMGMQGMQAQQAYAPTMAYGAASYGAAQSYPQYPTMASAGYGGYGAATQGYGGFGGSTYAPAAGYSGFGGQAVGGMGGMGGVGGMGAAAAGGGQAPIVIGADGSIRM